ncbi:AraC family transcriptional regulator [Kocuria sp. SM24M-10]|uniref:AraC family transcriptional regulator n=1 Tax=Kocuria sp. SM24M-10 TaxID=1660349 RepID=UPI00064A52B6|nr:AraC family transcriptional regulator [Kocuria sp. SM24M-10]KLU09884.1 hypothetical protein ABL57_09635 [Kocuria sp. SM24M-10]
MAAAARSTTTEDPTSPVRKLVVPDPSSSVRWHEHDWPHPLARWHYHPEVEVHLIRESSGTVMAGDWAGPFGPGHLSIMGSRLPHNWISHPNAFSRLFAKATGVGFNRTGTRMRLTEACRLLRGTDLPVSDICYRVGFTNLSNINRHFRATTGTTPSRYRRLDEV